MICCIAATAGQLRPVSAIVRGFSGCLFPVSTSADQTSALVSLRDVRFAYPTAERATLDGLTLTIPANATVGTRVNAIVRGKAVPMEVASMPFVPNRYFRG